MMREIKFRAWDKVSLRMIQSVNYTIDMFGTSMYFIFGYAEPKYLSRRDFELMQYTGLKDKNGKEIYEGDIIIADWHWTVPHAIELPDDYYDFTEYALLSEDLEVIGNIYENPELLKEEI